MSTAMDKAEWPHEEAILAINRFQKSGIFFFEVFEESNLNQPYDLILVDSLTYMYKNVCKMRKDFNREPEKKLIAFGKSASFEFNMKWITSNYRS